MAAVLPSPSHHPSSTSSLLSRTSSNDGTHTLLRVDPSQEVRRVVEEERQGGAVVSRKDDRHRQQDLSLLALLVTVFRKSWVGCRPARGEEMGVMEIGWPTNVRHVAHVTFDRFHGFLGLPLEFEPEVPRRVPSASASVFGVSAESMQCSFDNRGNSVPTILLLMQRRLYSQGGLQAEGIFRINAENSQEEYVRDQLNRGIVPDGIDVHCLAGLIKAWFRELPTGVLDSLTHEQVMQCHSEEDCVFLLKFLLPTEAAILNWAVNLMADVAQEEHCNKMNTRNVAMVFAPNMTQMADPLTALMYAVQVMNFLRTLIERELKDRQGSLVPIISSLPSDPSNENGHQSPQLSSDPCLLDETVKAYTNEEPYLEYPCQFPVQVSLDDDAASSTTQDHMASDDSGISIADQPAKASIETICPRYAISRRTRMGRASNAWKWPRRVSSLPAPQVPEQTVKPKGISIVSRINSKVEHVESWR